ncbi:MAG: signal peptidase II [Chromatiales bacterium 21-64-14]|nr:MAG: signal peptidase II [Chromatiales bacterium 21-64-14]HQU16978.1 signal peptidase II [Gammaproteobacteria bacterium]
MASVKRLALVLLVLFACVGCDQVTKYAAQRFLTPGTVITLADGAVRLQYVENTGAFLSLGAGLSDRLRYLAFTVATSVVLGVIASYLLLSRNLGRSSAFACSLILAGGISNVMDRVLHGGAVVDFLNVGIGRLRTGIFNVADVAIVVGALTLLVAGVVRRGDQHCA